MKSMRPLSGMLSITSVANGTNNGPLSGSEFFSVGSAKGSTGIGSR